MKVLVVSILSLLLSNAALAGKCPNLAGSYSVCDNSDDVWVGTKDLIIDQEVVDGETRYVIKSDGGVFGRLELDVIADGKTYDASVGDIAVTSTSKCSGAISKKLKIRMPFTSDGGANQGVRTYDFKIKKGNIVFKVDANPEKVTCYRDE
ncbi:hypothetical protein A9Q84_16910 [Halobacteriovorax marinus]|uniref:Lipoprotein n=1 Tax=Halobacteriovorax marinus TaxID=97084 RepID=A0A1Y5F4L2_9BACT|nr:hypothetical protein A9Q84_16910 [Halobacteriovorax marinus]